MRAVRIVVASPAFDEDLNLVPRREAQSAQDAVAEAGASPLQVVERQERRGGCGGLQSPKTLDLPFQVDLV